MIFLLYVMNSIWMLSLSPVNYPAKAHLTRGKHVAFGPLSPKPIPLCADSVVNRLRKTLGGMN